MNCVYLLREFSQVKIIISNCVCLFCREIRSNDVANWTKDDNVVTFMPNRTYIFDPETSCAGCNDKKDTFVTVNIPLLVSRLV